MRWEDIQPFNGSQNNAFEELVCQLARAENIPNKENFFRVGAPDSGVEAYCTLKNGDEYAWQAKYFLSTMGDSQWQQVEKSFKKAFEKHKKLKKYYICIPLDRADPRNGRNFSMDKWNERTTRWKAFAKEHRRDISFEYWGSSELVDKLSQEEHAGRKLFWFSENDFSNNWFEGYVNTAIKNLGPRYTPELNVELEIAKYFDAISQSSSFRKNMITAFSTFISSIKQSLHSLTNLNLEKAFDEPPNPTINDNLSSAIKSIESQFLPLHSNEIMQIDTDLLKENISTLRSNVFKIHDYLNKNGDEKIHEQIETFLDEVLGAISNFFDFIEDNSVLTLSNSSTILLSGEAGVGKSHLLGDIASKKIKEGKSCIFLLGQHFTSEKDPWTQILKDLLRINCNEKEFLGALSAKAEAQGERLLFIIDALDEGKGKCFWLDHINGFVAEFNNYPWLNLVLSFRSSYRKSLIPKELTSKEKIVELPHTGFKGIEFRATDIFFARYNIEHPSMPLLNPEFSNPLFLKIFCEGLHQLGLRKIPAGYKGITDILNNFLKAINIKLSEPKHFGYSASHNLVNNVVKKIIKYKLEENLTYVPYRKAFDITNREVSEIFDKKNFLDALVSEGVFSKNLFLHNSEDAEEGIYFAYERFDNHFTAEYLLHTCIKNNALQKSFKKNGMFYSLIEKCSLHQGILEALSIQAPERSKKELYELLDDGHKASESVMNAFLYSLIWRNHDNIRDSATEYIKKHVLPNEYAFNQFFQMIYTVALDPEHPYNADYLHKYLIPLSLADRDKVWTIHLHNQHREGTSMSRLVNWAAMPNKYESYLSNESRLLSAKALAWLFTSTNISFRDSATKALVSLLEDNIPIIKKLLSEFEGINDPYVYERIFAAAYGAVLRSDNLDGLNQLARYIVETIFKAEEVYPNVFVRDYARNIVEFAIFKGGTSLEDTSIISPPYNSSFPSTFPTNDEIDAYRYDYNSETFEKHYWSQNSILTSMITEYGRGVGSYGDFGRYTFQCALANWESFDPNDLSNYACKLIFEEYGYDVEKHGRFDSSIKNSDRSRNKIERIGKKYQWIALYEVLARLSDKEKKTDERGFAHDNKPLIYYQGPWERYIRKIDPTIIQLPSKETNNHPNINKKPYDDFQYSTEDWLISKENLPKPEDLISLTNSTEWLSLASHLAWTEPIPLGKNRNTYPQKRLWYAISSCLIKDKEEEKAISWLRSGKLEIDSLPIKDNSYFQVFSHEYYWSPAYKYCNALEDDAQKKLKKINKKENEEFYEGAEVIPTVEIYKWYSDTEHQDSLSYPSEYMFSGMDLRFSKNSGEWLTKDNEVVCISPPLLKDAERGSNFIVKKKYFQNFLKKNKLSVLWTCLGEKVIYGHNFFQKQLAVSGIYTLKDGKVDGEFKFIIRKI